MKRLGQGPGRDLKTLVKRMMLGKVYSRTMPRVTTEVTGRVWVRVDKYQPGYRINGGNTYRRV